MPIVVVGLSHRNSPVTVRERLAFAEADIPGALRELQERHRAQEAVVVSTCNRVELYVATDLEGPAALARLKAFLCECRRCPDLIDSDFYTLGEPSSLEHLFKVACGLDSMVLGETEILGQLKRAYELALRHKHTGRHLNKAFQTAFNIAKHVRTQTNIQRGSTSVGSVAVELAEKIFENLAERQVMVIGAGDTSEKTARALVSRGAKGLLVTNRSLARAQALAAELNGRAISFDEWDNEFPAIDIVISSTAAPGYVLDRRRLDPLMKRRACRPLLLIDIAVPRDIDPEVNFMENVFLYNIDDLQAIADDYLKQRQGEVARCERLIREKARALAERLSQPFLPGSQTLVPEQR